MLISLHLTVVFVVASSCLVSAFCTLFVTEGAGEMKKMEATETKTQKTVENNVAENQVIVETIPFFTNVITKVEDAINLTPLKVATIISAQHLIDSVNDMPAAELPQDSLKMLGNIVDEFNKTTQIIKLTAEYVNISSHYILNSLNNLVKQNYDEGHIKSTMKTVNSNFFKVISNHVKAAVREITEKTAHREMTGTDVLVSSAYHIVAAFQEMTSQVMSLEDNSKCNIPLTPKSSGELNMMDLDEKAGSTKHDVTHKSIKKDQAVHDAKPKFTFTNQVSLDDTLNINENPDLTMEIYPQESLILNNEGKQPIVKQEVKIPESLKVAPIGSSSLINFLPDIKEATVENKQNQSKLELENTKNKIIKKNLQNLGDIFAIDRVTPDENVALEIFPPKNPENSKTKEAPLESNVNNGQKPESFSVYYYPFETFDQKQNHLPNANTVNYLKVPKVLNNHYVPQDLTIETNEDTHSQNLKQVNTPFHTFSLFGNSNFGRFKNIKPQQKLNYGSAKSEGTQTNFKNLDDYLQRQDLTVEVFSPESFMHGKDALDKDGQEINFLSNMKNTKSSPNAKWKIGNIKNENIKKPRYQSMLNYRNRKNNLDKELASAMVDSLSNVPPMSYESKRKNKRGRKTTSNNLNAQKGFSTVLMPWEKRAPYHQDSSFHKNQQNHGSCSEKVEPVCGVDKNNFIIFINDCERKHHNSMYKKNYKLENMEACVGFILRHSSDTPAKYVNISQ